MAGAGSVHPDRLQRAEWSLLAGVAVGIARGRICAAVAHGAGRISSPPFTPHFFLGNAKDATFGRRRCCRCILIVQALMCGAAVLALLPGVGRRFEQTVLAVAKEALSC